MTALAEKLTNIQSFDDFFFANSETLSDCMRAFLTIALLAEYAAGATIPQRPASAATTWLSSNRTPATAMHIAQIVTRNSDDFHPLVFP